MCSLYEAPGLALAGEYECVMTVIPRETDAWSCRGNLGQLVEVGFDDRTVRRGVSDALERLAGREYTARATVLLKRPLGAKGFMHMDERSVHSLAVGID